VDFFRTFIIELGGEARRGQRESAGHEIHRLHSQIDFDLEELRRKGESLPPADGAVFQSFDCIPDCGW
jgi:hypothetical protein